jgi:iron transport multicopper oxidase
VTGWLVYDQTKPFPAPRLIDEFNALDDFTLTPSDRLELFGNADHTITLEVSMNNLGDGAN